MQEDMMDQPIYLLTVLHLGKTGTQLVRKRTWGWFPNKDLAVTAAKENHGDMYECGYYDHVVIEEVEWGACASVESETWLKATHIGNPVGFPLGKYSVVEVEKPGFLEHSCNFGIG